MNFLISSQQGLDQLKQKSMVYRCSTETQLLDTAPHNVEQKWIIGFNNLVCILSMLSQSAGCGLVPWNQDYAIIH